MMPWLTTSARPFTCTSVAATLPASISSPTTVDCLARVMVNPRTLVTHVQDRPLGDKLESGIAPAARARGSAGERARVPVDQRVAEPEPDDASKRQKRPERNLLLAGGGATHGHQAQADH